MYLPLSLPLVFVIGIFLGTYLGKRSLSQKAAGEILVWYDEDEPNPQIGLILKPNGLENIASHKFVSMETTKVKRSQ